jgi:hypothetical protein
MTSPFGLTDAQIFDERPGHANLFLDGPFEFFRLLGELLVAHNEALLLRGGR